MHTKLLIRPVNFISRYQQWCSGEIRDHLEMLRGSYANEVFGTGSEDLRYIEDKAQNRIIWQPLELGHDELGFLIDYFKELMLKNQYDNYISDERQEIFDNGIKLNVHRHYMKPAHTRMGPGNSSETFGNVFFEHHFNSKVNSISISVNYYGQNTYLKFEKLMELILK